MRGYGQNRDQVKNYMFGIIVVVICILCIQYTGQSVKKKNVLQVSR